MTEGTPFWGDVFSNGFWVFSRFCCRRRKEGRKEGRKSQNALEKTKKKTKKSKSPITEDHSKTRFVRLAMGKWSSLSSRGATQSGETEQIHMVKVLARASFYTFRCLTLARGVNLAPDHVVRCKCVYFIATAGHSTCLLFPRYPSRPKLVRCHGPYCGHEPTLRLGKMHLKRANCPFQRSRHLISLVQFISFRGWAKYSTKLESSGILWTERWLADLERGDVMAGIALSLMTSLLLNHV